jgi:hypothetical protein
VKHAVSIFRAYIHVSISRLTEAAMNGIMKHELLGSGKAEVIEFGHHCKKLEIKELTILNVLNVLIR